MSYVCDDNYHIRFSCNVTCELNCHNRSESHTLDHIPKSHRISIFAPK